MKLNKAFTLLGSVLLLSGGFALGASASSTSEPITAYMSYDINVNYNGENVVMKNANGERVFPIIYQGTTYIPIRAMGNLFDVPVDWDSATKTVLLGTSVDSKRPESSNSQTYGEQIVWGRHPYVEVNGTGVYEKCSIKFSSAIIEEKNIMVRSVYASELDEPYEEKTATFIKLQPGSTVEVSPNTYSDDPFDSEALCSGGGVILGNDHYEIEVSGAIDGFSSGTAEKIVISDNDLCWLDTDQFDTDYCFIVMGTSTGSANE